VRKAASACASTVQLNDGRHRSHIWAERYDATSPTSSRCGRDHRGHRRRHRAAALRGGEFPRQAQAAEAWTHGTSSCGRCRTTGGDAPGQFGGQACSRKAIAIDPHYGQALGVLAASHTFSAHMGWADMAGVAPIAERARWRDPWPTARDPWAHYLSAASICSPDGSTPMPLRVRARA